MLDVRDQATLREGRAAYFEANRFGADGGYALKWAPVKVGPVPLLIPNSAARVRALRLHDLNHVLTGYGTNFFSETEISCWELGGGCGRYAAAWSINLAVVVVGFLAAPRRFLRAFARGRRTGNLYRSRFAFGDALLDRRIGELRAELGLDTAVAPAELGDALRFGLWYGVGLLQYLVPIALIGLAWMLWHRLRS